MYYGSSGIDVTAAIEGQVEIKTYVCNGEHSQRYFSILDENNNVVASAKTNENSIMLTITNLHL